eukprot:TRINITY_DN27691_c0_g1_i1.p1 TRINITY_DN27691_c0_g1~~TRINITY_DN27691_c0_g1_i1.p1  ORF type:complete len:642 (-),score=140.02 TRINITY_DN27691_c0_g1_i1:41-1945(-)
MSFHFGNEPQSQLLPPRDASSVAPQHKATGRLRVRCLGARDLHPVDVGLHNALREMQLFAQGAAFDKDPYAVISLRDDEHRSLRRFTRPAHKTRHPQWRDEFWFSLHRQPEEYVLEVEVFGASQGKKQEEFLGHAELSLASLSTGDRQRCIEELPLMPLSGSTGASGNAQGSVRIEVSWAPTITKQSEHVQAYAGVMVNSIMGLRFLAVAFIAMAGLLMLVAQQSRWICVGSSFASCSAVEVPGTRITNFLGTAGFLGSSWREDQPFALLDLVETGRADALEDGLAASRLPPGPTVSMQVQQRQLFLWDVSLLTAQLCPQVSMPAVRLLTWFTQVMGMSLSALALLLAFLQDGGDGAFLGEACYMSMAALVLLVSAAFLSVREALLNGKSHDQEEFWEPAEEPIWRHRGFSDSRRSFENERRLLGDLGGSPGRRALSVAGLEDLAVIAQERFIALQQEAEQLAQPLAQPLVAAREDLQQRMQALQQEWEAMAQPFVQATQRLQEQLETQRQDAQNQLQAFQDRFRPAAAHAEEIRAATAAGLGSGCAAGCPDTTTQSMTEREQAAEATGRATPMAGIARNSSKRLGTIATPAIPLIEARTPRADGSSASFGVGSSTRVEGEEADAPRMQCLRCL